MNSPCHSASDVLFLLKPLSKYSGISRGVKPTHDGWRPSGTFSASVAGGGPAFRGMNRAHGLQTDRVYGNRGECADLDKCQRASKPSVGVVKTNIELSDVARNTGPHDEATPFCSDTEMRPKLARDHERPPELH